MIQIAHESMNCIQPYVQAATDYDYLLVHLIECNPEYKWIARNIRRTTVLDNSIFELGHAFDWDRYVYWIREIRPTYSVIPDVLDDADQTLSNRDEWFHATNCPRSTRYIAVAQGETEDDLLRCLRDFERDQRIAIIGISFNSTPFTSGPGETLDEVMMNERISFLDALTGGGTRPLKKPMHLLGCALPQEMKHYRDRYRPGIICSVDTSSPVVHGFYGVEYTEGGLQQKLKTQLQTLVDSPVTADQRDLILKNVAKFKEFTQCRS